jgi:hypothetical protein
VAHHLDVPRQRRAGGEVVELASQPSDRRHRVLVPHAWGLVDAGPRNVTLDPRQHLAALGVKPQKARGARPVALFEELQQLLRERARLADTSPHGVADPDNVVDVSASQCNLIGHISNVR